MIALLKIMPYTDATVTPSPNQEARRAPGIEGIVLHATADDGNEAGTLSWLCSPKSRVSCHLLVSRAGGVTRLVGDRQRAWHAGRAWWRGTSDVNSITLGIEIANRNDGEPYSDEQYQRVAEIVAHYCRQGLSLDDVVSHEAIAQDRRTDPFGWDWERFRALVQARIREGDVDGRPWNIYDRRSGERVAADEAAAQRPTVVVPASLPTLRVPAIRAGKQQLAPIPPPKPVRAITPPKQLPAITSQKHQLTVTATAKGFLCSRTIWLNGLTVLAAGSVIVGDTLDLAFSVGLNLPEEITMWALFGVGMVNILLRFQTTCPIGNRDSVNRSPSEPTMRGAGRTAGHDKGRSAAGAR